MRLDHSKILSRSSTGAPSSSQITYSGSGAAMSRTKSTSGLPCTSSTRAWQMSLMCSSSRPIWRGVKPRLTSERRRVWSGGSWLSIISRWNWRCSSGISSNRASFRAEEKRSE